MDHKLGSGSADSETILSHLKHHELQLILKRRWLMGLPIPKSGKKLLTDRPMPESFLREDDIFFETVKKHVEEAFGTDIGEREDSNLQETKDLLDKSNLKGILLSCTDALTNKGLLLLAMLLTRRSVNFEKTRPKLKKVIRESIPRVLRGQHNAQVEIFSQLSQLLKDQQNVRDTGLALLIPTYHHVSATKILDKLEELPSRTLIAMRKKLRGAPPDTPRLQQTRPSGMSRKQLIHSVRRKSEEILLELNGGDELQEPLAKALNLAGLSQKISPGCSYSISTDFIQFSPGIKALQNEIAKAIWLLKVKAKVGFQELKKLQLLLDPNASIPNASLRTAMKEMLTGYLFECSDLDTIPKSLLEALAIINKSSRSTPNSLKGEMEEEVECILNVSAQLKQIVYDFLPDHDFDEDFANAYMEELEESDGDDYDCRHMNDTDFIDSNDLKESCGEHVPVDSKPSIYIPEKRNGDGILNAGTTVFGTPRISRNTCSLFLTPNRKLEQSTSVSSGSQLNSPSPNICFKGENSAHTNLYLGIQEVCDEMSMVAYKLIGHLMEKFAQKEGLDLDLSDRSYLRGDYSGKVNQEEMQASGENVGGPVIVEVVEELLPSLSKSTIEKLKELVNHP